MVRILESNAYVTEIYCCLPPNGGKRNPPEITVKLIPDENFTLEGLALRLMGEEVGMVRVIIESLK